MDAEVDEPQALGVRLMNPRKAMQLEQEQCSLNRRLDTLEAQITDGLRGIQAYLKGEAYGATVSPQAAMQHGLRWSRRTMTDVKRWT